MRLGLSLVTETEATDYIVRSVENCLDVLGESGKFSYLKIMQTQYGLPISQVPYNPRTFVKALRELFGYTATVFEQRALDEFSGLSFPNEAISECVRNFALVLREDLNTHTIL